MYKVLVVGGETLEDYNLFEKKVIACISRKAKETKIMLYSVGDSFVKYFCEKWHIAHFVANTDWKKYGKNALVERNNTIINEIDAAIGFQNPVKDNNILFAKAVQKGIPYRYFSKAPVQKKV